MGSIYILVKVSKYRVRRLSSSFVFNYHEVEKTLHDNYKKYRVKDITKARRKPFLKVFVKIGKTGNKVKDRVYDINESRLKNGKTEYFLVNIIVLMTMIMKLKWIMVKPFLILIIISLFAYSVYTS